jgi:hypothetical protein
MPGLNKQQQQQQQLLHGANITRCQFVCLALTLSLGTVSQWYAYTGASPSFHAWGLLCAVAAA